jgi:hypothetical protein
MLRKTLFAGAAALAAFIAVSAASTDASAGRMFGGFQNHHAGRMIAGHPHRHTIGNLGPVRRHARKKEGCGDAECGGGVVPLDDKYILRQCNMVPSNESPLPPWCQGIPVPHGKGRGLRR